MEDIGAIVVHEDCTGRLWSVALGPQQPGHLKMVEVTNGTAEADGTYKTYWLRAPPEVRTAKEAVAWTYGLTPEQYDGLVVRT
jgi:hypothetical protein